MSAPSAKDLATTIFFDDDPAAAGVTPIRAVHLTQLQAAVNAVRVAAGLSPTTFAAALAGQPVLATHIDSLRTALAPARTNLGLPAVTYTRAVVSGILMRAYDINETRAGVL
jgi:hypothetical protein